MLPYGHAVLQADLLVSIAGGHNHARAVRLAFHQYPTPGINNLAMAKGGTGGRVHTTLRGTDDIKLVFYGAGTQQDLPVRGPGDLGKRGRNTDQLGPLISQRTEKFGEAQVIADREAETTRRRIDANDITAWFKGGGLTIASLGICHIHIKEMDLVVTRDDLTV